MIFSLEALQAGKGDSLILHFGTKGNPQFAIIDGGPGRVYRDSFKPRLLQLAKKYGQLGKLPVAFVMVSHIDDDHIHGILDWLADWQMDQRSQCQIGDFWFNSFDDGLKQIPSPLRSASLGASPQMQAQALTSSRNCKVGAVAASVNQGRALRAFLQTKGIQVNAEKGFLISDKNKTTAVFGKLRLTVISPNRARLEALFGKWREAVKKNRKMDAAAYRDQSVENLSSLVVMAEMDGSCMLLTGDARGDDIIAGLKATKFLGGKKTCHVDILKIPHHGSNRDVTLEFFKTVTADHYVISANGENDNPDADTLCWLAEARGSSNYCVYLTNQSNPARPTLKRNIEAAFKRFPQLKKKTQFRSKNALSIRVNLREKT
jgi:hypothetical protein